MRKITVNTVQGIGDLMWVYRKLSPLFERINFDVLIIKNDSVQTRAREFLGTLDRVGDVNFKIVTPEVYGRVARGMYRVDDIHGEYSVNAWLERGVHLDAIDGLPVAWDINLKREAVDVQGPYLLLYVSGCSHNVKFYQMRSADWAMLAIRTARALGLEQCILVGAAYDRAKLLEVKARMGGRLRTQVMADVNIKQTTSLIAGANYFIAYQSGLCMIAEEVGTPTLMVYYPENAALTTAWIRRENLIQGLFKNAFFGMPLVTMNELVRQHVAHLKANPIVREQRAVAQNV